MKFGEMLDWALRLRAFGALRAWVGARGPAGGIGVAWFANFGGRCPDLRSISALRSRNGGTI